MVSKIIKGLAHNENDWVLSCTEEVINEAAITGKIQGHKRAIICLMELRNKTYSKIAMNKGITTADGFDSKAQINNTRLLK